MSKQEELYQKLKVELGEEVGNGVILEMAPVAFGVDDYDLTIDRRQHTTDIRVIIYCMGAFVKVHITDFRNTSFKVHSMTIFHDDLRKMQEMVANNQ